MKEMFDILDENGNFLNIQVDREEAHSKGLWHRAVVVFLVSSQNEILLQRRSSTKKKWPNMLDVSAGGHSIAGEFGYETAIRETYEELGVKVNRQDLVYIGCTKNSFEKNDIKDNMFNEYYVVRTDLDVSTLSLQTEEVSEAIFVTPQELKMMMEGGHKEKLTPKTEAYEFLIKYLEKDANEKLAYWKNRFTSLDVYKNYEHKIEVIDQFEKLIIYRFIREDNTDMTSFKICCWWFEFSVWRAHAMEEDGYFPMNEEGFEKAVAHFKERL